MGDDARHCFRGHPMDLFHCMMSRRVWEDSDRKRELFISDHIRGFMLVAVVGELGWRIA